MPHCPAIRSGFALAFGFAAALSAGSIFADQKPAPAAAPASCKVMTGGKCCDPAITAHLAKEAVFGACGESAATYLGENASAKDSCRYYFDAGDQKPLESYVEIYAPAQEKPPAKPGDPFFLWKRAGKAFYSDKALSPKMMAMAASKTGLYFAGKNYIVMVSAMSNVCTKPEAQKLALKIK